mgnify:CR=1 FL=1
MDATHVKDRSDHDLLAAVAHGDRSAFERLYHSYEKRVYQYVRTLVADGSLAEEIVGDTMLAVWRGAGAFAYTSRVSTWMFGMRYGPDSTWMVLRGAVTPLVRI